MSWRGFFTGALALIALEAVVRTDESAGRFGQLIEALGDLARKFLSPTVEAIPNLSGGGDGTGRKWGHYSGSGGGGGNGGGGSW